MVASKTKSLFTAESAEYAENIEKLSDLGAPCG
jgi:hypothetical protein